MIVDGIRLSQNHIREITVKRIAPQKTYILRPLWINGDIVPMVRHFHSEAAGAAMYREPSLMRLFGLAVLNEVIAPAERSEAFIENSFLKLYPAAEIRDKAGIYARCFVNQFGSSRTRFLILRIEDAEQFLFVQAVLFANLHTSRNGFTDSVVKQGVIFRSDYRREFVHGNGASDVNSHVIRIKICTNPVCRADIAGIPCMDIGHLDYFHRLESRMVALRLYPLQGRVFNIIGEYFCRCVLSFDNHIVTTLDRH